MSSSKSSKGTLSETPIAQVMAFLYRRKLSGTLIISDPEGKQYKIFFIEGMPSYVEGKGLGHPVGEIIVEAGLMSSGALEKHLRQAREEKILFGQYLLREGIVDKRQLETAVRIQIRKRIKDIFAVFRGEFEFVQEKNLTELLFDNMVQTSLPAILPESLRLTWSDEMLKERLESIREHKFFISDYEACRKSFGWSRGEAAALDHLDEKKWSVGRVELEAEGEKLRDFRIVIYSMLLTGNLEFDAGDEGEDGRRKEEVRKKRLKQAHELMERKLRQIREGSYFDVLEVAPGAELRDIRGGFVRLLKEYHPDRVEPLHDEKLKEGFETISMKLKEAMDVLSDPEARKKYESHLREKEVPEGHEEEIVKQALTDELAYQKAIVLLNKHNWDDVVRLLEPAVERGTENGEYLAAYAWARINMTPEGHSVDQWTAMLRKAVELSPRSERVNFYLALTLQREGRFQEYETYIRAAAYINPHNIEVKRRLHILELRRQKGKKGGFGEKFKDLLKKKK